MPHASGIAELQLENSRLRRLVTDLLLEKIKLEEAFQVDKPLRFYHRRRRVTYASCSRCSQVGSSILRSR
jgi:hypothetical protein